ncbi:MAG: GDP-mannose 4,6-dehydratase [Bacteroidota bacterium]
MSIILVTGIGGFVGSYLAEKTLDEGHKVYGFIKPGSQLGNIEHIRGSINVIECDVTDEEKCSSWIMQIRPDFIYHFAAVAKTFEVFPREVYETNFIGTAAILEAVKKSGVRTRVMIPTSSEMYGAVSPQDLPLREDAPFRPLHPYAVSKVSVHYLIQYYTATMDLDIVELRPFNQIGPRQSLGFVVPDFASQLAEIKLGRREPVLQVGDLAVQRDFLDVRDAVEAYVRLAEAGRPGEAYHVCSGTAVSVERILQMLIEIAGVDVKVVSAPWKVRSHLVPRVVGSFDKIQVLTGWRPRRSLAETLSDTFAYWIDILRHRESNGAVTW